MAGCVSNLQSRQIHNAITLPADDFNHNSPLASPSITARDQSERIPEDAMSEAKDVGAGMQLPGNNCALPECTPLG